MYLVYSYYAIFAVTYRLDTIDYYRVEIFIKMFKILYVLLLLSILSIFAECKQLWHTSQVALNKLFDLQMEQFDAFKNYLDLETNRLEKLNK